MPVAEFARECGANARSFLASRGLRLADLGDFIPGVADLERVLLTSSPVHGLATETSDIDLIGVASGAAPSSGMASQYFHGGSHFELMTFSRADAEAALAELSALAGRPFADVVAAVDGWDRTARVRKKYLERIVNGVDRGGAMPYLDALPALGAVWAARSASLAWQCTVLTALSANAGQARAALGYAINAVWALMDALLAHHDRVVLNKKWSQTRWSRWRAAHPAAGDGPLYDGVGALWSALVAALRGGAPLPAGADAALRSLAEQAQRHLGFPAAASLRVRPVAEIAQGTFLGGAPLAWSPAGAAVLLAAPVARTYEAAELLELPPDEARALLRAIRGRAAALETAA